MARSTRFTGGSITHSRQFSAGLAVSKAISAIFAASPASRWIRSGYRALAGFTVGFGHLVSGEFGAGHVQQRFDDPRIGTIEGPSYRAKLIWRPTRLLDVHFKAEQTRHGNIRHQLNRRPRKRTTTRAGLRTSPQRHRITRGRLRDRPSSSVRCARITLLRPMPA